MFKNIPKTAIIGASGFLGKNFLYSYRQVYPDCVATSKSPVKEGRNTLEFNLLNPDIGRLGLSKSGHKEALILAGITKIDVCEEDKLGTRKVNVEGTLELIRQLSEEGIKPIFFSTDHIFDGKNGLYSEESRISPITEYGRQKAEVEAEINRITDGNFLIVRLSKVFSLDREENTLFDEMAGIFLSGATVCAASDQVFCPTLVDDVINAVSWLQSESKTGIAHVCSPEIWSRYDLAITLAREMGIDSSNVLKVSLDEIKFNPRYPKNTTMVSKVLPKGFKFSSIESSIRQIAKNWNTKKQEGVKL